MIDIGRVRSQEHEEMQFNFPTIDFKFQNAGTIHHRYLMAVRCYCTEFRGKSKPKSSYLVTYSKMGYLS